MTTGVGDACLTLNWKIAASGAVTVVHPLRGLGRTVSIHFFPSTPLAVAFSAKRSSGSTLTDWIIIRDRFPVMFCISLRMCAVTVKARTFESHLTAPDLLSVRPCVTKQPAPPWHCHYRFPPVVRLPHGPGAGDVREAKWDGISQRWLRDGAFVPPNCATTSRCHVPSRVARRLGGPQDQSEDLSSVSYSYSIISYSTLLRRNAAARLYALL